MLAEVQCGSCEAWEEANVCVYESSGGSTCNMTYNQLPCQTSGNSCYGEFYSAAVFGNCSSAPTDMNATVSSASILFPNVEGGYSEGPVSSYSCSVRMGRR